MIFLFVRLFVCLLTFAICSVLSTALSEARMGFCLCFGLWIVIRGRGL